MNNPNATMICGVACVLVLSASAVAVCQRCKENVTPRGQYYYTCAPACIGECGGTSCQVSDDGQLCTVWGGGCTGTLNCTTKVKPDPNIHRHHPHPVPMSMQFAPGMTPEHIRQDFDEVMNKVELTLK